MKRWGRLSCLLALGISMGAGCGGRTGGFSDGFEPGDGSGADGNGSGADGNGGRPSAGGAGSTAGRPARGGAPSQAGSFGVAGTISVGGGIPTAGAYSSGGAFAIGGAYPVAGTGFGGSPVRPGGECCVASPEPSCRPRAVAKCVCESLPHCCEKQWDEGCARLVEPLGCGYCESDCQSCLGRACGNQLNQCFSDRGCASIFSCVRETSCHPFECYTPGQCGGVIDAWGGPGGYSMNLLLQTFACSVQSGCPCN